jgi:Glyoxalase superfamily protein
MEAEVVPILRVADAGAAVRWYERLGFTRRWEHRFDPDCPAFVSIAHGGARLFFSEHRGDARPDTLVGLYVSDVDAVEAEFGRPDGEPPYGCEFVRAATPASPQRAEIAESWASVKGQGFESANSPEP